MVKKRVEILLGKIKALPANTVVVCGHGMVNRVMFRELGLESNIWKNCEYLHNRIVEVEA
jgi:broad specificity phosphatase PhoE